MPESRRKGRGALCWVRDPWLRRHRACGRLSHARSQRWEHLCSQLGSREISGDLTHLEPGTVSKGGGRGGRPHIGIPAQEVEGLAEDCLLLILPSKNLKSKKQITHTLLSPSLRGDSLGTSKSRTTGESLNLEVSTILKAKYMLALRKTRPDFSTLAGNI